jgi:hypothetical protein
VHNHCALNKKGTFNSRLNHFMSNCSDIFVAAANCIQQFQVNEWSVINHYQAKERNLGRLFC